MISARAKGFLSEISVSFGDGWWYGHGGPAGWRDPWPGGLAPSGRQVGVAFRWKLVLEARPESPGERQGLAHSCPRLGEGGVRLYRKTVLPNGVRIVTETTPHVRSVTIGFWFRAGSRDEDPAVHGISHFIEHMMFKGTATRTARQIAEEVDAAGGQLNAYTSKEHTCYYARVLDTHLPLAAEILSDMLRHSVFHPVELEKEKSVILEEIRMYEDSPDELVHDLFAEAVLGHHPLGRSVLGQSENILRLTRDDLLRYVADHYTGHNLVVAAAGNVQHEQVVEEIARRFGDLPAGRPGQDEQPVSLRAGTALREKDTEQVHLCIGTLGISRHDPDRFALYVLDTALGGGMSSRLFQELREERGLVYSTYSYHTCFEETGLFAVYAGTSPDHVDEVLHLILLELERVSREGIRGEELRRAKEQLKGSLMLSLESTANRMSRLAKLELFGEEVLTPDEVMARIDAVAEDEMVALCQRLFQRDRLSLAAIGPGAADLAWSPAGGRAGVSD